MMIQLIVASFATLFPIVNPLSTSLIFNTLTKDMSEKERKKIALKSSVIAMVVMTTFLFLGNIILRFFGITLYAFRIAGGLYLGYIGFQMLRPPLRKKTDAYNHKVDVSVLPLAISFLSGPGVLTSS